MNKRFVYFSSKEKFLEATQGTEYDFTSIVFIGDSKEIWNRGIFYGTPENFDIADYLSKSEAASTYQPIGEYLTEHQPLTDYAKTADVNKKFEGYYTKEEVDSAIEAIDVTDQLTEYAKKAEVTTEIESKVKAGIDSIVDGASTAMDTLKEVEDALKESASTVEALNQAIGNKANKSDIADMATKAWVNQQNYLTEVPAEYAKKTDIPSLEGYAKTTEVNSAIEAAFEWAEY